VLERVCKLIVPPFKCAASTAHPGCSILMHNRSKNETRASSVGEQWELIKTDRDAIECLLFMRRRNGHEGARKTGGERRSHLCREHITCSEPLAKREESANPANRRQSK